MTRVDSIMTLKSIGEITGLWTLVGTGFADVQLSGVATFLAAVWSAKLIGCWLYGMIKK